MNSIRISRFERLCVMSIMLAFLSLSQKAEAWIWFMFVAPEATITENFTGSSTTDDMPNGYRAIRITASNSSTFTRIGSPNMVRTYNEMQSGQTLRDRIDNILQISGNTVDVVYYLVDDRTGITTDADGSAGWFVTDEYNGKRHVWPAAVVGGQRNNGRYRGWVALSEIASAIIQESPGAWLGWQSTVIHETNHTQYVGESTKWGSVSITYGKDEAHYLSELLGSQDLAFEEGIGTFFGEIYNPQGLAATMKFLNRTNERYIVEGQSVLAGTPDLYKAVRVPKTIRGEQHYAYTWDNVPGYYILFSEVTTTAFHELFWHYTNNNQDQALNMINESVNDMWQSYRNRNLACAIHQLSRQLEEVAATTTGKQAARAGTLTSSMFPFALLDVLTHFGMTQETFQREYRTGCLAPNTVHPSSQPTQAYTEYFNHRANIQRLAEKHISKSYIDIEKAVSEIHRYFQNSNTILSSQTP